MKKVKKPVFFIVACIISIFTCFSVMGVHTTYGDVTTTWIRGIADIRWGIDIRGGVDVTFAPPEGTDATNSEMDAARSIIETRMLNNNITDYDIYVDYTADQIIVRFPWQSDDTDFDPEAAVKELGETAMLTFREGGTSDIGEDQTYEDLPLVLSGNDVESASNYYNTQEKEYQIALQLKDSGVAAFDEATGRLAGTGKSISIWMDDNMISQPTVSAHIVDGSATISGSFTFDSAKALADKINGGALPFKLETSNFSTISPTLGEGARDAMALAGLIGFAFIVVFMIARYRLPGFVASIALVGQAAGTFAAITGFFAFNDSFTLTIPGIAGIILALGMGVDANVITAERIKEELYAGKSLDGAINTGYKRAFSAIFDGNITMVIVAFILMGAFGTSDSFWAIILSPIFTWFGASTEGTIYSFGYTLAVGVILNFFFGILLSRLMTSSLARFRMFRKPALYGGVSDEK
ncbi:MAG: SecD/SecF family protein translocase subunit [Firmicutes bacterium]|nr:SecD/SecF family protein translocase subunit [[Eubacterium] siraeum]MCM1489047.1 SecD/SecF family protein translocase subunit [Bacillota bacterium]